MFHIQASTRHTLAATVIVWLSLGTVALAGPTNPDNLFPIPCTSAFTTSSDSSHLGDRPNLTRIALSDSVIGVNQRAGGLPSPVVDGPDGVRAYEATYPKGSFKPSGPVTGGMGFYLNGPKGFSFEGANEVMFSYSVYFPKNFDWVLGGKLPGLYGGSSDEEARSCSGGRQEDRDKCFSFRLMWRAKGEGEIYAYVPKTLHNNVTTARLAGTVIEDIYGISVARGAYRFKAGAWTTVAQRVKLNEVGATNGEVELWANGKSVIHATGLEIRSLPETMVRGAFVQSFFGGNTSEWATPRDQKVYFAELSGAVVPAGASPASGGEAYPLSAGYSLNIHGSPIFYALAVSCLSVLVSVAL